MKERREKRLFFFFFETVLTAVEQKESSVVMSCKGEALPDTHKAKLVITQQISVAHIASNENQHTSALTVHQQRETSTPGWCNSLCYITKQNVPRKFQMVCFIQ